MQTTTPASETTTAPNNPIAKPRRRTGLRVLACVVILLAGGAVAGYMLKFGPILFSEPYRQAMAELRLSPQVKQMLGDSVSDGWVPSGNVNNEDGEARFIIRVHGAKAADGNEPKAQVSVQARLIDGKWGFTQFDVQPENGEKLNLIDEITKREGADVAPFKAGQASQSQPTKSQATKDQNVDIQIPDFPADNGKK